MAQANTTRESSTGKHRIAPPAIALPKGAGTIRGMGEQFTANPVTRAGALRVPLATLPGHAGFGL